MNNISDFSYVYLNLLLVIVFLLFVYYFFKKYKFRKYSKNSPMRIINTIQVGNKERIILMEVNKTSLLIGATSNHIETLHVFDEPGSHSVEQGNSFSKKFNDAISESTNS